MTVLVDTFWTAFPAHTPLGGNSACTEGFAGAGQLELMKVSHPHSSQLCVQRHHTDILKSAMVGELALWKLAETFSCSHLCALECWLLNIYQHTT